MAPRVCELFHEVGQEKAGLGGLMVRGLFVVVDDTLVDCVGRAAFIRNGGMQIQFDHKIVLSSCLHVQEPVVKLGLPGTNWLSCHQYLY